MSQFFFLYNLFPKSLYIINYNNKRLFRDNKYVIECKSTPCMFLTSAGSSWWRDLGRRREVAPTPADPRRLKVHKEPGCDDLGHRDPQKPKRHRSRHQKEERRSAQTATVAQQAENRQRWDPSRFSLDAFTLKYLLKAHVCSAPTECLYDRVSQETADSAEITQRLSKVNKYICEKIMDINKSIKNEERRESKLLIRQTVKMENFTYDGI